MSHGVHLLQSPYPQLAWDYRFQYVSCTPAAGPRVIGTRCQSIYGIVTVSDSLNGC